ncbi:MULTISPECIES: cytochrome c biogenesis protein CcsA [Micromonospora]|uniref:Heme exporter protein C n=1 Tax=Micromonospora solifontis TaxID=2487138 RepID=A0ABX9WB91_9ACTN|nr:MULTISPECIES: cytochrome c biogenesis protein CcsA [Micromonospora]NES16916.1 cytochrome c biogenesis protein CcsA [Micromonospora sp. PPF5-17B]NES39329.1 cytochrome c biogenesis protein CcsA [Micromonospora solifontis]NES58608.1 cytochrome c biogenesis protein CcsA [Micromonospora sp. PPF5-6]RNL89426.1 cytochrome C biogenesis protein [Micromonospora solifontis]
MPTTTVDLTADNPRGAHARRTTAWIAAGLATAAGFTGALLAPADAAQGQAQRLMYLHVPAAWVAYLAFAAVLAASVAHLINGDLRWDRVARAGAEIGVVLTAVAIGTGSLWGHLVWGTWWAWDPRLVSTALLLLAYTGYLALRRALAERTGGPDGGDRRISRPAAVAGIAGFLLVPVVHFSVLWWRSLHQQATILAPERPPIDPRMALALLLAVAAASTVALLALAHRVLRLERRVAATGEAPTTGTGTGRRSPAPVR